MKLSTLSLSVIALMLVPQIESQAQVAEIAFERNVEIPGADPTERTINGVRPAFSPDGKTLAIYGQGKVACIDTTSWEMTHGLQYNGLARTLAFTPAGTEIVVFNYEKTGSPVFSLKTGRQVGSVPLPTGVSQAHIHPTRKNSLIYGATKFVGGRSVHGIIFFDGIRKREAAVMIPNNTLDFYSSAISPKDGEWYAISTDTRLLIISTTPKMKITHNIAFMDRWPHLADGATLQPAFSPVFSPDGSMLAVNYRGGHGRIFDTESGKVIEAYAGDGVLHFTPIGFLDEGKKLAVSMPTGRTGFTDLGVINVATGKVIAKTTKPVESIGHTSLSPDGTRIAISKDVTVVVDTYKLPELD